MKPVAVYTKLLIAGEFSADWVELDATVFEALRLCKVRPVKVVYSVGADVIHYPFNKDW